MKLEGFKDGELFIQKINDSKTIILIFPGGGYNHLGERETYPVANRFNELGYNSAYLNYSVKPYTKEDILKECDVTIKYLAKEYENIILMGFSAGGHLAGLLATSNYKNVKALVAGYSVFTMKEYTHLVTRDCFFNNNYTTKDLEEYSIENRITKDMVPTFLWTMETDTTVNPMNTFLVNEKLEEFNIKHECIIFSSGVHGISLADETTIKDNNLVYVNKEVAIWPYLVDKFLKELKL